MGTGAGGRIDLTTREEQILLLLAKGYSDKDVARELGLNLNQLRNITREFKRKFEAKSRVEVVVKAVVEGVLVIGPD